MSRHGMNFGVRAARNIQQGVARDEEAALAEIHRVKRANRHIRSTAQHERDRRPVWRPGDPIPECHIRNQRLRDAAAAAAQ